MRPNSFSATCVTEHIPCRFCYTTHSVLFVWHDSFYFMCVTWRMCDAMGVTWVWHAPIYGKRFIWLIVPYVCDMTRSVSYLRQNAFYAMWVTELVLCHVCDMTCVMPWVWHAPIYGMCVLWLIVPDVCAIWLVLCQMWDRTHSMPHMLKNSFYFMCVTWLVLFHVCAVTCSMACVSRRNAQCNAYHTQIEFPVPYVWNRNHSLPYGCDRTHSISWVWHAYHTQTEFSWRQKSFQPPYTNKEITPNCTYRYI